MKGRQVKLKVFYWHTEEIANRTVVHVGGRTQENKTVHALIDQFTPYIHVELPIHIEWDKHKAGIFFKYLQQSMGTNGPVGDVKTGFKLVQKSRLHYLKDIYAMFLSFPSERAAKSLSWKCNNERGFLVPGLAQFYGGDFKVHEANIDPILKMSAAKNIELANWIEITESIPEDEMELSIEDRKFTSADIDMRVNWNNIKYVTAPDGVYIPPTYCSFDLECNSHNHNSKMPNPETPENVVMQISMVFGTLNDVDSRYHVLISLGEPRRKEIKKCNKLILYKTEKDLLLGFSKLIRKHDPDLFIHYNGLKFDWDYMIKRTELLGIFNAFSDLGRVSGKKAELRTMKWSSAARGEQVFSYLECHGRTNVDVLIEIENNHRLPTYTLNAVGEHFLKQTKEDVSARELFMLWDLTHDVLPLVRERTITPKELIYFRAQVEEIFEIRKCTGNPVKTYREKLLKSNATDFSTICREAMEIIGTYCIQDTILPIELIEKLNIWTGMEAMSNVTHVPVSYLHTRGQQIKVLSQVYRETLTQNIVIPTLKKTDKTEKYQGATVIEANAGDYENVPTLDFASLYPTVMIAFNISYDTILEDDDPTPDEDCHVLIWSDHVACVHDPKKRKRKAEDVLCKDHRYRFRKVKYIINKNGDVKRKHEGVMPRLERNLLGKRKLVKKEMAKVEALLKMHKGTATEDDIKYYTKVGYKIIEKGSLGKNEAMLAEMSFNTHNANQLALKLSANSAYGCMGVNNGMLPLIAGAASVTAMGRRLIMMAIDRIKKEYSFVKLVYGDSVSADTPILCRMNGSIFYRTINNLPAVEFEGDDEVDGKIYIHPFKGLEVWSDKGFTPLHKIIKHKTTKKMYRVLTHTGCVDVTEDHSLLNEKAEKIKPGSVKKGDILLHKDLPQVGGNKSIVNAYDMGKQCAHEYPFNYGDILECNDETRQLFFDGYVNEWNDKPQEGYLKLDFSDKLKASYFYLLATSLGYHVRIDMKPFRHVYMLNFTRKTNIKNADKIKKIVELPPTEEYVYDLETENHHFAAGVGRMVVHNTDSCMLHFTGKTLEETWVLAEEASGIATHHIKCYITGVEENHTIGVDKVPIAKFSADDPRFKDLTYLEQCQVLNYQTCPIDLEFENLYAKFLLLTKKRYYAYSVNRKGELLSITKKGIVLTRRDNSKYLRDTYEAVIKGVLDRIGEQNIMYRLYDRIQLLFTRGLLTTKGDQLKTQDLIIYMGIKSIQNYAKSRKEKKGRIVVSQVPIDQYGVIIDDLIGPLDPRLVYPNLPQVLLALKMMRRGEDIPPNSRLEFLYLQTENWTHQGQKAEDYTYYKEFKEIDNLKPDWLHYLEKQLAKPITELLTVKFSKEVVPFVPIEDRFRYLLRNLRNDHLTAVARQTGTYIKQRPSGTKSSNIFIGWDATTKLPCDNIDPLANDCSIKFYTYKNFSGQATYVIDQMKHGATECSSGSMTKEMYPDLFKLCTWYKSTELINVLHKQFGIKKRRWIRPTYKEDKLRDNTKMVMLDNSLTDQGVHKGDLGKIIERFDSGTKKEPIYTYTILFGENEDTGHLIKDVPRKSFNTYTIRDGEIMKDIFKYRTNYAAVVDHINELSIAIKFID